MTYAIQRADERGKADHGWLQSRFSFSFADYRNPHQMGFKTLRVINDDIIAPHSGFGMHAHRDMEIVTIVTRGAVEHRDDMGNHGKVSAWEVQRMSAGTGVMHAEFNQEEEPLHLFQIWLFPEAKGLPPSYEQRRFDPSAFDGTFVTLASGLEKEGLYLHQKAEIQRGMFSVGSAVQITPKSGALYLFVIEGSITLAGEQLQRRDAMAIDGAMPLQAECETACDLLLFHL